MADTEDGGYQTILTSDADEHLSYLSQVQADGDVWVADFTDATKYIREKQNCTCNAYDDGNGTINVFVELSDSEMSYETFNQPLTVKIRVEDSDGGFSYKDSEGNSLEVQADSEGKFLLMDVIPGNEGSVITYE